MKNVIFSIIVVGLVAGFVVFLINRPASRSVSPPAELVQNIEIRDGVQYVTINARGGYFPRTSSAKANMPTKLVVKTDRTFDCSAALVIRSIGYQKILPQTGEEVIDIGQPASGTYLHGICSMGMYSFTVNFS